MGRNLCFGLAHVVRGKRRIAVGSFSCNVAASYQLIVLYILASLPQTFRQQIHSRNNGLFQFYSNGGVSATISVEVWHTLTYSFRQRNELYFCLVKGLCQLHKIQTILLLLQSNGLMIFTGLSWITSTYGIKNPTELGSGNILVPAPYLTAVHETIDYIPSQILFSHELRLLEFRIMKIVYLSVMLYSIL